MTMPQPTGSPFAVRGVVEGFYGVYYTTPQRIDLIRFLGAHGFNRYLYGPKNDRQHRNRWREPYPAFMMDDFAATVVASSEVGVTFSYALSPGVTMCYSSAEEFATMTQKLRAFYDLGVRVFCLFLDDIAPAFHHAADTATYPSYAAAHVDLCNRTLAWLRELDAACELSMCPTIYHGRAPFDAYLAELGAGLDPAVDVYYTGPEVCSMTLSAADAAAFAEVAQRPPLIWDNYPVNDGEMQAELHIGPLRGRDPQLAAAVRGVAVNPMNQPEASKIALLTWAEYLADPAGYDPEAAWPRALTAVAGEADVSALWRVAENSLYSCLEKTQAPILEALTRSAKERLHQDLSTDTAELAALEAYLTSLDEAVYHLRNRARNLALRADLLPWLEQLENWYQVGRHIFLVLRAPEAAAREQAARRLTNTLIAAQTHPKRIAGDYLASLADLALAHWQAQAT